MNFTETYPAAALAQPMRLRLEWNSPNADQLYQLLKAGVRDLRLDDVDDAQLRQLRHQAQR